MNTRRLVFAAILLFVVGWGTLLVVAMRQTQIQEPQRDIEPAPTAPLSREEIARHNRPDDCWLVIRGKVYDVTSYISSHPTPSRIITEYCGQESTEPFETKGRGRPHSPQAWQMLNAYLVGEASAWEP